MDASTRAVITAVLAALVAATAFAQDLPALAQYGGIPVVVAAAVLALLIAVGWPLLLGLPNLIGSSAVIALGGIGAVITVTATRGQPFLRELPVVVALGILLCFVNELARQDGRTRLVDSVAGSVTGLLVATAAAGWVAAVRAPSGTALVVSGAVALAMAAAASAMPLGVMTGAVVTAGAAVVAGAAAGAVMPDLGLAAGAMLGLGTGILVAALHVMFDRMRALKNRLASMTVIVLPVALSGIVVYVVGRVLVG